MVRGILDAQIVSELAAEMVVQAFEEFPGAFAVADPVLRFEECDDHQERSVVLAKLKVIRHGNKRRLARQNLEILAVVLAITLRTGVDGVQLGFESLPIAALRGDERAPEFVVDGWGIG